MSTLVQLHDWLELDNTPECMRSESIINVEVSGVLWSKEYRKHESGVEKELWQKINLDVCLEKKTRLPSFAGPEVSGTKVATKYSRFPVAGHERRDRLPDYLLPSKLCSPPPLTSPSKCSRKIPLLFFLPTRVRGGL